MAVQIAAEYGLLLDYIDMGGGYFGGRDDMPDYRDYFKEICRELSAYFDPKETTPDRRARRFPDFKGNHL